MSKVQSIFERIESATTASVVLEGLSQAFGDSGRARAMDWLITENSHYSDMAPVDFMAANAANIPTVAKDVAKLLQGFSPAAFR